MNGWSSIPLVVETGPYPGQVFVMKDRAQTIGRGTGNEIFIANESLSRSHARITPSGGSFLMVPDIHPAADSERAFVRQAVDPSSAWPNYKQCFPIKPDAVSP